MNSLTRKNRKWILRFTVVGFAVTVGLVAYLALTNTSPPSDPQGLLLLFVIFCPPSLLSIPIVDAETGTSEFYFVFAIIGLLNEALYGACANFILRVRNEIV